MREIRRSAIVPYSPAAMYALVADVESYPEFLPGCRASRLISRDGAAMTASLSLEMGPLSTSFTTRNDLDPPNGMTMTLVEGPFRTLSGEWRFTPLGTEGCRVELTVRFELASKVRDVLLGTALEATLNGLVDAFVRRAGELYGAGA